MSSHHDERATRTGSRREREFRRYGEAVLGMRASVDGETAISSRDVSLTAFAQLVTLRVNAKRALISLFDKTSQYILAEATQTLSLQADAVHNAGDAMYWGKNVIPRGDDFAGETLRAARKMKAETGGSARDAALIIPDLTQHENFANHPHVVGHPYARCYVGVPLLAPNGFPIGTLSLLDDRPRPEGIPQPEIVFMRDVATSIMTHLEMKRVETAHVRGVRMVRGLSCFMEGKYSVTDPGPPGRKQDVDALNKRQTTGTSELGASSRTHALNFASNAERMVEARESNDSYAEARSPAPPSFQIPQSTTPEPVPPEDQGGDATEHVAFRPSARSRTSQVQDDATSKNVPQTFERAASVLQQAMDVAGALFLDASGSEFGSLRSPARNSRRSSASSTSHSVGSGEDSTERRPSTPPAASDTQPCRYLGAAYAIADDDTIDYDHGNIPERFLRSVMKRHPYGKIYNFGEDGLLPSDEQSDSSASVEGPPSRASKRKRRAVTDSIRLQKIFPGVRALAVMPMWDSLRQRFYAGAVAWTYNTKRLFSFQEDLNYFGAFCDVVMAEVTRLDTQADVQAKTSFISSVSHELRSPLHGILGACECLQEEADDASSRLQMVQMIDTCGRSLLDIVTNLLEHSTVVSTTREQRRPGHKGSPKPLNSTQPIHDISTLTEEVLHSALWSTPDPSPQSKYAEQAAAPAFQRDDAPLKVILDLVDSQLPETGWYFHVNAGAWRRILQNLTTNSIKYTDKGGFLKVTLRIEGEMADTRSRMVNIDVTDSGRGMSAKYVKDGLWQAFTQEDSYSQGTGLGLSLVRGLVQGMRGRIGVQSAKGVGTTIKIRIPLSPGTPVEGQQADLEGAERVKGLTLTTMGFGSKDSQGSRAAEASELLDASIRSIGRSIGLATFEDGENGKEPDVYIMTELHAISLARKGSTESKPFLTQPVVILCDSVNSSRTTASICSPVLKKSQVVSQPLGRMQLLKAILAGMEGPTPMPPSLKTERSGRKPSIIDVAAADIRAEHLDAGELSPRSIPPSPGLFARPSISPETSSVLLVDDNQLNLSLLQRYMVKLGREHVGASDGREAVEAYQSSHSPSSTNKPSSTSLPARIVFMDITMPVMDGLEATRRIRAWERLRRLKPAMIVALTALASPQARQEAYSSGIDLFLTKPVQFRAIEGMFRDWEQDGDGGGDDDGGIESDR